MCYNVFSLYKTYTEGREMNKFLDAEKALEVVLYISKYAHNLFNIVKTLYFADKLHLEKYGRQITGDYYIAMNKGPVPSGAFDLIKLARGDKFRYEDKIINTHPEKALKVVDKTQVYPNREPNLDLLSETDIECLNEAINQYGKMSPLKLKEIVKAEKAYKKNRRPFGNKKIPLKEIILFDVPNGKEVLEYLNS